MKTSSRRLLAALTVPLVALLVWGLVLLVRQDGNDPGTTGSQAGTAASSSAPRSTPRSTPPSTPAGGSAEPEATVLPPTSAWRAGPGEPQPEVKQTASAFIETAGTWVGGTGAVDALRTAGIPAAVASTATALEAPDAVASTVQVIYPQYGGLVSDRSAVMVLFDQNLAMADGSTTTRQLALDVRLVRQGSGDWAVELINPLTSLGSPRPLSETARAVLAQPRIELSAPARLDVSTGRMSDALLRVLLGLAEERVLTVQVMATGHIQTVFPTDRVSNHAVGRAVDIRAIDGQLVVDPSTSRDMLADVVLRAGELGATEVGAPFDLNGERTGFFTDIVHQDHLHIGITPGKPPATR